jgi:hypothetical protein
MNKEKLKIKQQAWEQLRYTAMQKGLHNVECQCDDVLELFEIIEKQHGALNQISDILDGENVTPLVERLAYILTDSGIYK